MRVRWLIAAVMLLSITACSSFDSGPRFARAYAPYDTQRARTATTTSPIQHVVFIIQENRSFNNLFMGFPKAETKSFGYDQSGDKIVLRSQALATQWDIDHVSESFYAACDSKKGLPGTHCKMDGWNNEQAGIGHPANAPYAYVTRSQIKPYWTMAQQYVLADKMFASNLDASFIAHQYAVAAYASHTVDGPLTSWGCEGGPSDTIRILTKKRKDGASIVACFNNPTIGTNADTAGVSWRFYAGGINADGGLWSAYQAISPVYNGPDWSSNVINPPAQFLTDIKNNELANVTWITPNLADSDHPGLSASDGPAWVASLVDAVGKSKFWNSTAIFVMWDDWGGWFDPVQPIYKDYDGLGFRVPLIVISPYAKKGSVTHTQYETSSVVRFIEDNFNLPQMAPSDTRAKDPAIDPAVFDYAQAPRPFKKIPGSKPASFWFKLGGGATHGKPNGIIGDD
ncbi:MAG TPA: alkaline phosphatase family protein [Candidatus Cybelea sp.]|nr:alkaline phosphatase family protein [Candidatus Cybelea sp.]